MQHYNTIIGVISLRLRGESYTTTQLRYGVGSSTVTRIMTRYNSLGLSLDELKATPPDEVEKLFYPPESMSRLDKVMPDFNEIHRLMMEMEHPDLSYQWLEYRKENPDGYGLSQFYKLYNDFCKANFWKPKTYMPVERIPGERMFIDWVGDKPKLLTDPRTGELIEVHIFVTTLGFSSYMYAEAFPDEKLPNFIAGVVHALEYYGAAPKYLVPDNLKTAVTKHTTDKLVLNPEFMDLESFYDVIVLPPPARKPKGKATVEQSVRLLETHLIEPLKRQTFTSLETLNDAVKKIVAEINQGEFHDKKDIRKSRIQAFETYDKPAMKCLPNGNFTICDYKVFSSVPDNYHLEYDGHYYSIVYTYFGKPAILKATTSDIIICDEHNRFICQHKRAYKAFPRYITDDSHMPKKDLFYKELNEHLNEHDGDFYRRWAHSYGKPMEVFIDRILCGCKHEEQAYKSCKGILYMCKGNPASLAMEAAQTCIDAEACSYNNFKKVYNRLKAGLNNPSPSSNPRESLDSMELPEHTNIRGGNSYK